MAGVNEFIRRLEKLAAHEIKDRVMHKIADAAHAEAIRGFNEQRDPYGTPWAKRKDTRGTWPILQRTGAGVDSLTSRAVGGRVVMRIKGYFRFHQTGTGRMVARMVFPDPVRGLGTWGEPLNKAARDAVSELVNGRSA